MIPVLLAGVALYGMGKRVDVYGALTHGAEEGLTVLLKVLPALVGLLTAVAMFRASGALEWLTGLCAPALEFLGIPPETTPLMLVRPVSGLSLIHILGVLSLLTHPFFGLFYDHVFQIDWELYAYSVEYVGAFLPLLLLSRYTGRHGTSGGFSKWFFYMFYPLHLLVLGWLRAVL